MASVFSRHESNRARLERSRKTSCWPPTTPANSPRTGKSSSERLGQSTPSRTVTTASILEPHMSARKLSNWWILLEGMYGAHLVGYGAPKMHQL
ncbi:hypothetical protein TNCV_4148151 [Trichonephila clavipes]|nr:hypothetical protein TNCV_4148151 [Trichonephila clavipes]